MWAEHKIQIGLLKSTYPTVMLRRQNLWEGGKGKETRMSNQATRKNVVGLLEMGP